VHVPPEIEGEWTSLGTSGSRDNNLRSVELLLEWLDGAKRWLEDLPPDALTGGPRVSPKLSGSGGERGITDSRFDGVDMKTLRHLLRWSDPERSPFGAEERGRDPKTEADPLRREIEARARA
jgi:hypothetical protein